MASLDEIQAKQQKMLNYAQDMQKHADDPEKVLAMADRLVEMGKELEKAALSFAASFGTLPQGAEVRVELTKDQRARVAEATGVPVEMLVYRDSDGTFTAGMPKRNPEEIEALAAAQVAGRAIKKAKDDAIKKLIKTLEDLNEPTLEPVIEEIKKDPTLQGLLEKQLAAERERKANQGG